MKKLFSIISLALLPFTGMAQFHTVKVPQLSPKVSETQRLGITDITIDYHSPATKGRDVWATVVRNYEDPNLAWRAGANMNTRISFSTDVTINGKELTAGSYGFHVDISDVNNWTLLFAHHDNLWGSYYLNKEEHISLSLKVSPEKTTFSEQLNYRFIDRSDSSVLIALEWADKRIPFKVVVDLNETVLENFRYELLGINTYRWEAWNDAARWCYDRNINLEEALIWVNRSIEGGYGGFASNRNFNNVSTKVRILNALGQNDQLEALLDELKVLIADQRETFWFGQFLIDKGFEAHAITLYTRGLGTFKNEEHWAMDLGLGQAQYKKGNKKAGLKNVNKALETTPEGSKGFVQSIIDGMKE